MIIMVKVCQLCEDKMQNMSGEIKELLGLLCMSIAVLLLCDMLQLYMIYIE